MTAILSKPEAFRRIEFWGAATLFLFSLFFVITDALDGELGRRSIAPSGYMLTSILLRNTLLFGAFFLLNFLVVPKIMERQSVVLYVLLGLVAAGLVAVSLGLINTALLEAFGGDVQDRAYRLRRFQRSALYTAWLAGMFLLYCAVRHASIYLLMRSDELRKRYPFLKPEGLIGLVVWMVVLFLLLAGRAERVILAAWSVIGLMSILWYHYASGWMIPSAYDRKHPFRSFLLRSFLWQFPIWVPVVLASMALAGWEDPGLIIALFNGFFLFLVVSPLAWVVYRRRLKGGEEIVRLQRALGQSHASLDFLRSQINPHFLFNALNTIYGTALQEGAERTSEGVQRLGDMMRFMLQENVQDRIPLAREVEYLNNYIALQRLRTDSGPHIRIETAIDEPQEPVEIAPMLLIPFVENAFKHGISFREPSYIRITLGITGRALHFDVLNSRHKVREGDPERDSNGVGLQNVRQRLQLLYPKAHELTVRETATDFFAHLTLHLSKPKDRA